MMHLLLQIGDRVYWTRSIDGSYKELTLTNEHVTFPLNPVLSFEQGAALGVPYFTAYRALVTKAGLKAGETVLIHGASGAVSIESICFRVWGRGHALPTKTPKVYVKRRILISFIAMKLLCSCNFLMFPHEPPGITVDPICNIPSDQISPGATVLTSLLLLMC